mgnify:CR=1 FL=1
MRPEITLLLTLGTPCLLASSIETVTGAPRVEDKAVNAEDQVAFDWG